MAYDLSAANETLLEFDRLVREGKTAPWSGNLKVGVDLGTANIVVAVVDEENRPVAGMTTPSRVVRDGIVVDYVGAVSAVTRMKRELEERLGCTLDRAATAIPPGIIAGNVRCIANVIEGAGFEVSNVIDEPTAAATVLGIDSGAVVDVGGGTTGISVLKNGTVEFTGDEPTGGTHMTLVLAGFHHCTTEEAEEMKKDPKQESNVFPVVRPVVEKMAAIVARYLQSHPTDAVYVVGGACCFSQFETVFEKNIGIPTYKPEVPLLVTPLGIAMNA
ncbi:MAG TPA: ethanolamine utilization protein EutJ [Candidatus Flavonifractor merdipullorum]|uniref:Ethanolamine utilization protein EutJ n=1 Tax=Candidatus Flavonifractor merdipullorum TaxID=2838590 RepID=A0A9D1RV55_9FIRM|nr:ethanolamine utilization protein EutJ [Candidatus Flavonifractor merdipullorum]